MRENTEHEETPDLNFM